jgi:hypothetical protein
MAAMLDSLIRVVLNAIATSHNNEAKLRAEVLALRRQVQVLERQIKRVRWELGEYCAHYSDERPHRSFGLRPPATRGEPIRRLGATIRRRARGEGS